MNKQLVSVDRIQGVMNLITPEEVAAVVCEPTIESLATSLAGKLLEGGDARLLKLKVMSFVATVLSIGYELGKGENEIDRLKKMYEA